uniref:Geranylgeranyl pyrophosphate synthase n=1 Tax=Ascaris suum TaxID=6253 RepID=F1L5V7_ASCSU
MDEDEAYLMAPFVYISKVPGKHVRSRLATAFNLWLKINDNPLELIMCTVEMLHNASLLIDDIEDSSILRRGIPVAHSVYGVARTINTGNYVYFVALSKCLQLAKPKAIEIFCEKMLELHRGQGKELYWRDTMQCPTESQYEEMVIEKTGGLFSLTVRLMELFSVHQYNFTPLINNLALYCQIRDDYINLCSRDYAELKSFAEDLTDGKFSFPIVAAVRHGDADDEILNILRQKTKDNEVKKYCIRLLHERGAISHTLNRLKQLHDAILSEVKNLGGNELLENLVETLSHELINDSNGTKRTHLTTKK